MTDTRPEVPTPVVKRLRAICLALPDAYQEPAWVGTRWRVRTKTFADILMIDDGRPPAYVLAFGNEGPLMVVTFQSSGDELDALTHAGPPFHKPRWNPKIMGLELDSRTDWIELAELVTESYCLLAPKKLSAQVRSA